MSSSPVRSLEDLLFNFLRYTSINSSSSNHLPFVLSSSLFLNSKEHQCKEVNESEEGKEKHHRDKTDEDHAVKKEKFLTTEPTTQTATTPKLKRENAKVGEEEFASTPLTSMNPTAAMDTEETRNDTTRFHELEELDFETTLSLLLDHIRVQCHDDEDSFRLPLFLSHHDVTNMVLTWAVDTLLYRIKNQNSSKTTASTSETGAIVEDDKKMEIDMISGSTARKDPKLIPMNSDRTSKKKKRKLDLRYEQDNINHHTQNTIEDEVLSVPVQQHGLSTDPDIERTSTKIHSSAFHQKISSILLWNTMVTCLEAYSLLGNKKNTHVRESSSNMILTQSTMNKILPWIIQIGFCTCSTATRIDDRSIVHTSSQPEKDESTVKVETTNNCMNRNCSSQEAILAAKTYTLLLSWKQFHPSFDFACNILVTSINQQLKINYRHHSIDSHTNARLHIHYVNFEAQYNIILSTLHLLRNMLLRQGILSSNPKKIFSLLLSEPIISTFAFLYSTQDNLARSNAVETKQKNDQQVVILNLVQDILWTGFFHPEYHIDGYRTMNLPIPTIRLEKMTYSSEVTPSKTEVVNIAIDGGERGDPLSTSNSNTAARLSSSSSLMYSHHFASYQQNFFKDLGVMIRIENEGEDSLESNHSVNCQVDFQLSFHVASIIPLLVKGYITQSIQWEEQNKKNDIKMITTGDMSNKKGKRSNRIDIHQSHFMFWSNITLPLVEQLKHSLATSSNQRCLPIFLQRIFECVQSLSDYKVYLPFYSDQGNKNFTYLRAIGETILRICESILIRRFDELGSSKQAELNHSLTYSLMILENLLHLNHKLVHEQMPWYIWITSSSMTIAVKHGYCELKNATSRFFASMCNTYGKLRQLKYFFSSIVASMAINCHRGQSIPSPKNVRSDDDVLQTVLRDSQFLKSLLSTVQTSPSDQIYEIWAYFMQYFEDKLSSSKHNDLNSSNDVNENVYNEIDVPVFLFVLVIRAIFIEESNALSIQKYCENAFTSIVRLFLKSCLHPSTRYLSYFDLSDQLTNSGLYLFGWLIELHSKCVFWRNETASMAIESLLTYENDANSNNRFVPMLLATVRRTMEDGFAPGSLHALQHLSCHRIQQLHAVIFQQQNNENMLTHTMRLENRKSNEMFQEAKLLVDFIVRAACNRKFSIKSTVTSVKNSVVACSASWTLLVKHLTSWTPYAENEHITMFVSWFFHTLAVTQSSLNNLDDGITVIPGTDLIPGDIFIEERQVASKLLCDASFLEIIPIMDQFLEVGIRAVLLLMMQGVSKGKNRSGYESVNVPFLPKPESSLLLRMRDFEHVMLALKQQQNSSHPNDHVFVEIEYMERALNVFKIVLGLYLQRTDNGDPVLLLSSALQIHYFLHSLVLTQSVAERESIILAMHFLSICRIAVAYTVSHWHFDRRSDAILDAAFMVHLALYMGETSIYFISIGKASKIDGTDVRRFVDSGSQVMGSFFTFCLINFVSDPVLVEAFIDIIRPLSVSTQEKSIIKVTNHMLQTLLFRIIHSNRLYDVTTDIGDSLKPVRDVIIRILSISSKTLLHQKEDVINFVNNIDEDEIIFFSDMIHVTWLLSDSKSACVDKILNVDIGETVLALISYATKYLFDELDEETHPRRNVRASLLYFLCSLSRLGHDQLKIQWYDFSLTIQRLVVHSHIKTGLIEAMLDSCYAELVVKMNEEHLRLLVSDLLVAKPLVVLSYFGWNAAVLYCFETIITSVRGEKECQSLSEYTQEFVHIAMEQQCSYSVACSDWDAICINRWISSVHSAHTLLIRVISLKKTLYSVQSHEIAAMLTNIGSILCPDDMLTYKSTVEQDFDVPIIVSCCSLVSALLKHYPKRLYLCSPCVTSAFRAILLYLMHDSKSRGVEFISQTIPHFTKLCETFAIHKDVFKKHVVGLILDFVTSLGEGMDTVFKNKITESVYFLIDMLSVHEIGHMNTLMSDSAKILFRTIHLSYQKQHLYQGQF